MRGKDKRCENGCAIRGSGHRAVGSLVGLPSDALAALLQRALDQEVVEQVRQHFLIAQDAHRDPAAALTVETHKLSVDFPVTNWVLGCL